MTATEIITGLIIHLIIPLFGLLFFLHLRNRMKNDNIQNKPEVELFIIFATYGGLLLVILTELFWNWSGMASLGTFYLILGAPIVMGLIFYRHRHTRHNSKYHQWTYILAFAYLIVFVIAIVIFLITLYLMGDRKA